MSQVVLVSPTALVVDDENPRIADEGLSQREAMRAVAGDEDGRLLLALAEDIVTWKQLNPGENLIVYPSPRNANQYIVGEGNRRLTALRALENPDTFVGAVPVTVLDQIRKLSAKYRGQPITEIQCCIMEDAKEREHWIDLRHNGPKGGVGLVPWGPHQKARFEFRKTGKVKIHVALLDFLENGGHLSGSERRQVPLSSFERLVKSPDVRKRVGVSMDTDGKLHFINEETAVKGLLYILRDLNSGEKKTADIYTSELRKEYARDMPTDAVPIPIPTSKSNQMPSISVMSTKGAQPIVSRTPLLRLKKEREKLIPPDCRMRITDQRIRRVSNEILSLTLREHPNALAVLFRVFLELSADYYLVNSMKKTKNSLLPKKLTEKLTTIVEYLENQQVLARQEAAPVRAACQRNTFLATSVLTMNEYIHNALMNPTPTDLRAQWDGFEPFFKAIWP